MCFLVLKTFFELMWSKDRRGSFRWIVSVYIEKGPELFFWHRPAALKDNQFIKLMNPCWTPKGELDSAFCFVLLGGCGHWCSGVKRSVCSCCRSGWEQERHSWKHLWSQALHIQLHHFNKVSIFLLVQDPFSVNSLHSSTWPLTFRVQSNWMQTESSWHRELRCVPSAVAFAVKLCVTDRSLLLISDPVMMLIDDPWPWSPQRSQQVCSLFRMLLLLHTFFSVEQYSGKQWQTVSFGFLNFPFKDWEHLLVFLGTTCWCLSVFFFGQYWLCSESSACCM